MLGSLIISFGIYNFHYQCGITEGGELGVELLLKHFFNISPAITALVFDIIFFILGVYVLGNKFFKKAIVGTISYSIFYYIWELFPPVIMDLSNYKIIACIVGALFVGLGSGLAVKYGGSCGGDDSLALVLAKITKLPVAICYFLFDFIIIMVSISYIGSLAIIYSFITAFLSSLIIGLVNKK